MREPRAVNRAESRTCTFGEDDQRAMAAVGQGALDGAKSAVELAISLVGTMTLFLGLMKVVDVVVATGGGAMVKSAYSSGKPSFGVGIYKK